MLGTELLLVDGRLDTDGEIVSSSLGATLLLEKLFCILTVGNSVVFGVVTFSMIINEGLLVCDGVNVFDNEVGCVVSVGDTVSTLVGAILLFVKLFCILTVGNRVVFGLVMFSVMSTEGELVCDGDDVFDNDVGCVRSVGGTVSITLGATLLLEKLFCILTVGNSVVFGVVTFSMIINEGLLVCDGVNVFDNEVGCVVSVGDTVSTLVGAILLFVKLFCILTVGNRVVFGLVMFSVMSTEGELVCDGDDVFDNDVGCVRSVGGTVSITLGATLLLEKLFCILTVGNIVVLDLVTFSVINDVGLLVCDGDKEIESDGSCVESVGNIDATTLGDTLLSVGDNVGGNVVVRQQVQFTFGDSPPLSTPNTIKLSTSPHTLSDTCPLNSLLSSRSSTVDKHLFDNIEQIQLV